MSRKELKVFVLISLLIAVQLLVSCAREAREEVATGVKWLASYEDAVAAAKKNKQPIMIDFYADWCGWCKKLDKSTYVDKDVVALAKEFVSLKIDADVEGSISSEYKVVGLPTILFIDATGKELHRVVGYRPPAAFLDEMNVALESYQGKRGSQGG
jgi:thiol:disulfide interchange protein